LKKRDEEKFVELRYIINRGYHKRFGIPVGDWLNMHKEFVGLRKRIGNKEDL